MRKSILVVALSALGLMGVVGSAMADEPTAKCIINFKSNCPKTVEASAILYDAQTKDPLGKAEASTPGSNNFVKLSANCPASGKVFVGVNLNPVPTGTHAALQTRSAIPQFASAAFPNPDGVEVVFPGAFSNVQSGSQATCELKPQ